MGDKMQWGHMLVRPDFPDVIDAASRMPTSESAIVFIRDSTGFDHVTYQLAHSRTGTAPFIRSTYPAEWISRYLLRGYAEVDPIAQKALSSTQPFLWHELTLSPRELEFMADARAHGVGDKGYTIPITDRYSRRAALTLATSTTTDDLIAFTAASATSLAQIAHVVHHKALQELSPDEADAARLLAPREAECLLWTARGKEAKAIAAILNLSEYTVRSYLRTARQKLECKTLSQAVAKAIQHELINP